MLIIGERINSSRKAIKEAIEKKDKFFLIDEARRQSEAGADYIDINCAMSLEREKEDLQWLIKAVQEQIDVPICIDSPNPNAIEAGLLVHKGKAFINSTTAERGKIEDIIPLAKKYNSNCVCLAMDEKGMPQTAEERLKIIDKALNSIKTLGFDLNNIYFDLLVRPIASEPQQGKSFLEALTKMKQNFKVKAVAGISNISFGLPNRRLLNATFLMLAADAGLDAAMVDPLDKYICGIIKEPEVFKDLEAVQYAKNAILGEDQYCMNYIKAARSSRLKIE